jgi:hypothetical protein
MRLHNAIVTVLLADVAHASWNPLKLLARLKRNGKIACAIDDSEMDVPSVGEMRRKHGKAILLVSSDTTQTSRVSTGSTQRAPLTVYDYWLTQHPGRVVEALLKSRREDIGFDTTAVSASDVSRTPQWTATVEKFNSLVATRNRLDTTDSKSSWAPMVSGRVPGSVVSWEVDDTCVKYEIPLDLDPFPLVSTLSSVIVEAKAHYRDEYGAPQSTGLDVIIKYTNTCGEYDSTKDPLREEYLILETIAGLGIAPEVWSLSLPIVPSQLDWVSNDFRVDSRHVRGISDHGASCSRRGAFLRAFIQERAGMEVSEYIFHKSSTLIMAIRIGLGTIRLLEKLHNAGFVHGDIHGGNVVVKDRHTKREDPELSLIDFGLSKFFPSEFGSSESADPYSLTLSLLSPWHLASSRIGRRDDLYRALELTVDLIRITSDMYTYLDSLSVPELFQVKNSFDFFNGAFPGSKTICQDYKKSIPEKKCTNAMNELGNALAAVRGIAHVDATPDYESIKRHFENAMSYIAP